MCSYVLIVDDHPMNREVFSLILEHGGFRVRVARDGQEAVDMVRADRPAAILMDLSMPRMDGYKAAAVLQEEHDGEIPIVAITAHIVTRSDIEPFGFCGLLQKPVTGNRLLKAVRTCTSRSAKAPGWVD